VTHVKKIFQRAYYTKKRYLVITLLCKTRKPLTGIRLRIEWGDKSDPFAYSAYHRTGSITIPHR
jgi:hypothetical protein